MANLTHSVKVDRDSRAIRFYLWLYHADPAAINTCKLFWAFVFSPLVLLLRLVITPAVLLAERQERKRRERLPKTLEERVAEAEARKARGPSRGERAITKLSMALSAFWAKAERPAKVIAGIIVVAYALLLVTMLVIALVNHPLTVLLAVACVAAVFGIGYLIYRLSPRLRGFLGLLHKLGRSVHDHTCARVVLSKD